LVWPRADGELSRWMHWLMTAHVRRYLRHHGSGGHVWQGRFRAFPIQKDKHLLTVSRDVWGLCLTALTTGEFRSERLSRQSPRRPARMLASLAAIAGTRRESNAAQ